VGRSWRKKVVAEGRREDLLAVAGGQLKERKLGLSAMGRNCRCWRFR